MDYKEAELYVKLEFDIYTFEEDDAKNLAIGTGATGVKENHINSSKATVGGQYFDHFHSSYLRHNSNTYKVHIFFGEPQKKYL